MLRHEYAKRSSEGEMDVQSRPGKSGFPLSISARMQPTLHTCASKVRPARSNQHSRGAHVDRERVLLKPAAPDDQLASSRLRTGLGSRQHDLRRAVPSCCDIPAPNRVSNRPFERTRCPTHSVMNPTASCSPENALLASPKSQICGCESAPSPERQKKHPLPPSGRSLRSVASSRA